ncbi:MAG: single-stranded DNA-binding protein [Eubacterium sp.]|nr:single-stranded DNA-binding protein [Eubacterium sp.]
MATHNYVRLLGALRKPPKIISLANSRAAMFNIIVINKSRFEKDTYYYNVPTIFTEDEMMIDDIVNYKEHDIVEVEGVITTKNVIKASLCEYCGQKNVKEKATIFVVTPLYLCLRESGIATKEESLRLLQPHAEISNKCFAIGTLLRDPELIAIGKKKRNTVRYPLAIHRKYYIRDNPDTHSDYPWVNTIGEQAEDDMRYLHAGSVVYIDGYIQTRNAIQTSVCSHCGESYHWKDSAVEIIGYSVEYLQNYYTPDEVIEHDPFDVIQVEG